MLRRRQVDLRVDEFDRALSAPSTLDTARLQLDLFDDVQVIAEREALESDPLGHMSWLGHADGDPLSTVTLTRKGRALSGTVMVHGALYRLRGTAGSPTIQIDQLDPSALPEGAEPVTVPDWQRARPQAADLARPQADPIVDVIAFYTPAIELELESVANVEVRLAQGIADANLALRRSRVTGQLRLVEVRLLAGFIESGDLSRDLLRFRDSAAAAEARDAAKADVAVLLEDLVSTAACGIAFLGPVSEVAYSIVPEPCIDQYSLAHEIAHNFGAHHAPEDGATNAWKPYGYGYKDRLAPVPFRTVMAYDCAGTSCPRVLNFSSPEVLNGTRVTGTSTQNNARLLREAFPVVQNFRGDVPTEPPSAPLDPVARVTGTTVFLSWEPPAEGVATRYRVVVGSRPGGVDLLDLDVGASVAFSAPAAPGTYYVRIYAGNAVGESEPSTELAVTVGVTSSPPGVPRGVTADVFGNTVRLTWSSPNTGPLPTRYLVEVGSAAGLADITAFYVGGPFFVADGVPNGLYYIRVRALVGDVTGGASASVPVQVGPPCSPPTSAPTSVTATLAGGFVSLSWTAPDTGTSPFAYRVEVGTQPGEADVFGGLVGSSLAVGTPLPAGTGAGTYFLRVRAANSCGTSPYSGDATITVP